MLKDRIYEDLKLAMKARLQQNVQALRLVTAQIKQFEVDKRLVAGDEDVIHILNTMAKQRRDSIQHYQAAARDDLVQQEAFELSLIQTYLPTPLTESQVLILIENALQEVSEKPSMGTLMAKLKPLVNARFDMSRLSMMLKQRLSEL